MGKNEHEDGPKGLECTQEAGKRNKEQGLGGRRASPRSAVRQKLGVSKWKLESVNSAERQLCISSSCDPLKTDLWEPLCCLSHQSECRRGWGRSLLHRAWHTMGPLMELIPIKQPLSGVWAQLP